MTPPPAPPRLTRPTGNAIPPLLPSRYTATMLGTPYRNGQVCAVRLLFQEASANFPDNGMLIEFVGAQEGKLMVLYSGDKFYLMSPTTNWVGPFDSTVSVPGTDWLRSLNLSLQGHGDLMSRACDWWLGYSPNQNGYVGTPPPTPAQVCNWFWLDSATGFPFRMFFTSTGNPTGLPFIGTFFSTLNVTEFTPLISQEDAALFEAPTTIETPSPKLAEAAKSADTFDTLLAAVRTHAPELEHLDGAPGDLIEGLGPPPPNPTAPFWSPRMWLTGYTFQTSEPSGQYSGDDAMPLRVFYEYDANGKHMLTRCALSQFGFETVDVMDIILSATGNQTVIRFPNGGHVVEPPGQFGLVKPNWAAQDNPVFRAQIDNNPVLCPGKTLIVTTLPSDHDRWFWVWYTQDGHGQLFMETPQCGDVGLVLTDYFSFDTDPPPFPPGWHTVP